MTAKAHPEFDERLAAFQQQADTLVAWASKNANSNQLNKLARSLDKISQNALSAGLIIPIQNSYVACAESLEAEYADDPAFALVLQSAKCLRKNFQRLDYRIESDAEWEFTVPGSNGDADRTIKFFCSYVGDNEGEGKYAWSCGPAEDTRMPMPEVELYPTKDAGHASLIELLGFSAQQTTELLDAMMSSSFS
eukprot:c11492_g1_i1.p1 GENE.c11492_g1_i1~~c11492_g1_i1.p1  ORF type:complete len:193 (+),score=40.24 c11492_g1_i1:35-613(+)